MLARAIATEAGAAFFDLSPKVIEDKCTQPAKTANAMLIWKVLLCAQDMSPSVIYIDEIDQVFAAAGKKKKVDPKSPVRIKKDLSLCILNMIKRGSDCTEQDRILFIGATSKPYDENVDKKEFQKVFDEKVWVSWPEYGSRKMLWEKFMERHGVNTDRMLVEISTLAQVSQGFSAGSIKQTVDRVLTPRRVQQLKHRPLKVVEFLGPLSRTAYTDDKTHKKFQDFDDFITGQEALYLQMKQEEADAATAAANAKGKK